MTRGDGVRAGRAERIVTVRSLAPDTPTTGSTPSLTPAVAVARWLGERVGESVARGIIAAEVAQIPVGLDGTEQRVVIVVRAVVLIGMHHGA